MNSLIKRPDNAGYEAQMGSINSRIITGGRDIALNKVLASVNCSAHNDEAWFDINHIDSLMLNAGDAKLENGKASFKSGEFGHEFYTLNDNELEWMIVFDSRPKKDTVNFKIKHSNNLSFSKQILTPAEILEGAVYRKPEAEGSYAVYMDKRNNKYQTGKVGHIYTPYLIDANGVKSPLCGLDISPDANARIMTVTMPSAWLDAPERAYPVRLDPILGYDTMGSFATNANAFIWFNHASSSITDASGGEVKSFHFYPNRAAQWKIVLYECPQTFPYDPEGYNPVEWGWTVLSVVGIKNDMTPQIGGVVLDPNTNYRLGVAFTTGSAAMWADNLVENANWHGNVYGNIATVPVSPLGTTISNTSQRIWSAWAVYEAIAAGGRRRKILLQEAA